MKIWKFWSGLKVKDTYQQKSYIRYDAIYRSTNSKDHLLLKWIHENKIHFKILKNPKYEVESPFEALQIIDKELRS